jgi:uroporphyrin-3 C-methyltransferase
MSKQIEQSPPSDELQAKPEISPDDSTEDKPAKPRRALLPIFNLLLLLALIAALGIGGFKGWQLFQQNKQQAANRILELKNELASRPTQSDLDNSVRSMRQSAQQTTQKIAQLEQGLQSLTAATEKLYELYGRDENGWKLSEVEYLMSVAQHKLVLENDFAGAAKTLNAASNRIAELADPGLLPVRVKINEEIAQLKTRERPDLVGMTLTLARLTRQAASLKPGYQTQSKAPSSTQPEKTQQQADPNRPLQQKVMDFVASLVTIKTDQPRAKPASPQPDIIDVSQQLEDNLKLTRWALLDRDAFQYSKLMQQNVEMFKQYYDLNVAANAEFYDELLKLQKASIKPELPDISGSLKLLKEIEKKRESAPQQAMKPEADNG